jgi:cytidylate kinase
VTLVALSGAYGAGGSRIGPALAERLGVPFLDRAIAAAVSERLAVPLDDAAAHDEQASTSWLERLLRGFIGQEPGAPTPMPAGRASAEDFRRATEDVLMRQAATGEGVILGRGSVILLRDRPDVLRARLDGPASMRLRQAMRIEQIDASTARRRMRQQDQTHAAYARRFYDVDVRDPSLYHLVLDSTAIPLQQCVQILLGAARACAGPRQDQLSVG